MAYLKSSEIISKISLQKKISEEEVKKKISEKMNALSGLISEDGAAHIVANELGVALSSVASSTTSEMVKIKDLDSNMKNVSLIAKVVKKYEARNFSSPKGEGKVGSLLLGDESGVTRLTFWNDKVDDYFEKISEGDIVEVTQCYARDNNGRVEIQMGSGSKCDVNPKGKTVEVKEQEEKIVKFSEIKDDDQFISILATIVQVFDPRFFEVCPECKKRLRGADGQFNCPEHGTVTPTYNFVTNLFLDDSTDNMRVSVWSDLSNDLFGKTREEMQKYRDNPSSFDEVKNALLGKIIKARARVQNNEMYARKELVLLSVDMAPEPQEMSSKVDSKPKSTKEVEKKEVKPKAEVIEDSLSDDNVDDVDDDLATEISSDDLDTDNSDDIITMDDLDDLDEDLI